MKTEDESNGEAEAEAEEEEMDTERDVFWKMVTPEEISEKTDVVTPRRYVDTKSGSGDEETEDAEEKMQELVASLREHRAESRKLDKEMEECFQKLGL